MSQQNEKVYRNQYTQTEEGGVHVDMKVKYYIEEPEIEENVDGANKRRLTEKTVNGQKKKNVKRIVGELPLKQLTLGNGYGQVISVEEESKLKFCKATYWKIYMLLELNKLMPEIIKYAINIPILMGHCFDEGELMDKTETAASDLYNVIQRYFDHKAKALCSEESPGQSEKENQVSKATVKNNNNTPSTEQWHKAVIVTCLSILHLGDPYRKIISKDQLLYLTGLGRGSKQLDKTLQILTIELPIKGDEMLSNRADGTSIPNSFICKTNARSIYSFGSLALSILKIRMEKDCNSNEILNHKTVPIAHVECTPKLRNVTWFLCLNKGPHYLKLQNTTVADQLINYSLKVEGSEFTYKKKQQQKEKETNEENKEDADGSYSDYSCIINV